MPQSKVELKLVGTCNRCGLCCTVRKDGRTLYCDNLERNYAVGLPQATRCKAYIFRTPGMPIILSDELGIPRAEGYCSHGLPNDAENIVEYIGKGCSLQIDRSS